MKRFFLFLFAAFSLAATACQAPVKPTSYLDSYDQFSPVDEPESKLRYFAAEDLSLDPYLPSREVRRELKSDEKAVPSLKDAGLTDDDVQSVLFIVEPPLWTADAEFKSEEKDDLLFTLRERFYRYLLRTYPHPVRVRYAFDPSDPRVKGNRLVRVESAITDIEKGSGFLRYMIGYGAGRAVVQVEGRLWGIDDEGGDLLLGEFAFREGHGAYPNGFINVDVIDPAYCVKYAIDQGLKEFTPHLRGVIPGAVPLEKSEQQLARP